MKEFLESLKLPKLILLEINNPNSDLSVKNKGEGEYIVICHHTNKSPGSITLLVNSIKYLRKT